MKKSTQNSLIIAISAVFCIASLQGCVKEKVGSPNIESIAEKPSEDIEKLKVYMANLIGVNASDIQYDEERKMFTLFGYDQISLESLNASYQQSFNK